MFSVEPPPGGQAGVAGPRPTERRTCRATEGANELTTLSEARRTTDGPLLTPWQPGSDQIGRRDQAVMQRGLGQTRALLILGLMIEVEFREQCAQVHLDGLGTQE